MSGIAAMLTKSQQTGLQPPVFYHLKLATFCNSQGVSPLNSGGWGQLWASLSSLFDEFFDLLSIIGKIMAPGGQAFQLINFGMGGEARSQQIGDVLGEF